METDSLEKDILLKKQEIGGISVIAETVELDTEGMKAISFNLRRSETNLVLLLASKSNNKVILTIMVTDDLVQKGKLDASSLIGDIATEIGGSGGGQPFFATAGGSNPSGIDNSFDRLKQIIRS